ncbi:hypothetical protein [Pseudoxanthomonas dokdonensis]|uniref:Uncharacterized protein n=1 Tax=Pseudoxanthomonas dokdonensis TaxID=344882 RepID=A0A0R0CQR7_9GAMM|nr:hypothetical protein [Pseudoxanthomonas dokdonensis]KRG71686.1 hypothetical protein ABB29_02795 [Pseudoxanthomonas dokdonensis]
MNPPDKRTLSYGTLDNSAPDNSVPDNGLIDGAIRAGLNQRPSGPEAVRRLPSQQPQDRKPRRSSMQ